MVIVLNDGKRLITKRGSKIVSERKQVEGQTHRRRVLIYTPQFSLLRKEVLLSDVKQIVNGYK
jgi:hypothetical protein